MPIQILMPALSPTMTEGTLAKWAKAVGDTITSGDLLAEIETDKATMEIEAVDEGILGKILVAEGTEGVPVNQLIGLILEDGEDASALEAALAPVAAPAAPPAAAAPAPAAPAPAKTGNRIIASPLARRLATTKGVDLATVTGSGPKGRIVKRDVESAAPGAPAPKADALTGLRYAPNGLLRHVEKRRKYTTFHITVASKIQTVIPFTVTRKHELVSSQYFGVTGD